MPGFCASIFLVFISGVGHFNFIVDWGKSARAWLEGNPQEHHVVAERNYGTLEIFQDIQSLFLEVLVHLNALSEFRSMWTILRYNHKRKTDPN